MLVIDHLDGNPRNNSLDNLALRCRPMWQALAHELARTKPGEPRLNLLNSLYADLLPADKLRVQAEQLELAVDNVLLRLDFRAQFGVAALAEQHRTHLVALR